MTNATQTNHAEDQAKAQYESVASMVTALQVDYDRLEELKDEKEELETEVKDTSEAYAEALFKRSGDVDAFNDMRDAVNALNTWKSDNEEELSDLIEASNGCTDQEAAREAIQEDPLSVQVRSDWENSSSEFSASEFQILLCTGGPAVRIMGELQEGQPCRAWLEYQDWGTPWTMYFGADQFVLLAYCQEFYFGE